MRNQNAHVSEHMSMVAADSTIFAATSGGYLAIPRKKLVEVNGSWVESMRSSSPTRAITSCLHSTEERNSWIVSYQTTPLDQTYNGFFSQHHHPSALDMFDEIIEASKGKQIVMFLDYDGTLSPIVDDPDRAFMSTKMRRTVRKLAKFFPTAIVSGRCRDKVYKFVRLAELYYAGSHGMDIKGPRYKTGSDDLVCQPASEYLPIIDDVYKDLVEKTNSTPGVKVENNKFCVSVHFRCVPEKDWNDLAASVRSVLKEYPKLRLTQGRKVLEIRPSIKWDKGKALKFLLESLGYANCTNVFPVYIGDDRTDEDAFKVLRDMGNGFGIVVSKFPKDTDATYSLQEPAEVMDFLHRLAEWKSSRK